MTALARNNVAVSGNPDGQPMVFAHGFGCDQNMWRFVAPRVRGPTSGSSCSTTSGAGGSDLAAYDADRYSSLDGYAADVLEICRELDLRDVIFVGHSVSAMIGALRRDRGAGPVRQAGDGRPVAPLHRRRRLRRRLHRGGHRRAARLAREQLPRLVDGDGAR